MSEEQESQGSHIELRAESFLDNDNALLSTAEPLYRPLLGSEIRLIRFGPGRWDDPIGCDLVYVLLDDRPKYVALSYVWGDPTETQPISLNGKAFNITSNLFSGLRRLREIVSATDQNTAATFLTDKLENFYLWVDAVCINQDDVEEKSRQITRMGDVYTLAYRVYAWLGENPVEQEDTIQRTLAMVQDIENLDYSLSDFESSVFSVLEIISRTWFSRIWVIQEVALATHAPILLSGAAWSPLDSFMVLYISLSKVREGSSFRNTMERIRREDKNLSLARLGSLALIRVEHQTDKLVDIDAASLGNRMNKILSHSAGQFDATVPHDYIYGLLGLMRPGKLPHELKANYSKGYPLVYQAYARFIIENTGNLFIILRTRNRIEGGVPSWVPDFRCPAFVALRDEKHRQPIVFSHDGNQMTLTGSELGTCTLVNIPPSDFDIRNVYSKNAASFLDGLHQMDTFLQRASKVKEISKDEVLDQWLEHVNASVVNQMAFEKLKELYLLALVRSRDADCGDALYRLQIYLSWDVGVFSSLVTENGIIANLQRTDRVAELGDVLVVVEGTSEPLLLRRTTEVNKYLYVGHCSYRQPFDFGAALSDRAWKEFVII